MKQVFSIFLLVFCFNLCYSQNLGYKLFENRIFPTVDTNYQSAKNIFLANEKKYNYDPSKKLFFLIYSLKNKDVQFFKHQITAIIKNYGYSYVYSDTLGVSMTHVINQEIYDHGLTQWLAKKSKKLFPKWLKKNPEYIKTIKLLEKLHSNDQLIRGIKIKNNNTTCFYSCNTSIDSILNIIDLNNIIAIQSACVANGYKMLTNFDNGYNTFNQIMFIIFHNLKEGANTKEVWERLFPYLEKAYLKGKISSYPFHIYDYYLNFHFGSQYYGTLENDVPIKNPDGFEKRENKVKF